MVVGYFKMSRIIDKLSFLILLKLWDPAARRCGLCFFLFFVFAS